MRCVVTEDLNRHFDDIAAQERVEETIEARVEDLLQGDCNPLTRKNFDIAMVENFPHVELLSRLLREKKYEIAGRLLEAEAIAFWRREARERVERSL